MKTQETELTKFKHTESNLPSDPLTSAVAAAVQEGLSSKPKWLPAWLFYDAEGSFLFEQITRLPEYYLTRTERHIFHAHADAIISAAIDVSGYAASVAPGSKLRLLELGAGSASKTGILLRAAVRLQGATQYLPIDVSEAALEEAVSSLALAVPNLDVRPQLANYVTDALLVPPHNGPTLALYIGSSIGNFAPDDAVAILRNLRRQMRVGDCLLLGTDLVKHLPTLLAAYNDDQGVTAAFNLNMLRRINRDLGADFDLAAFRHEAVWNAGESRMEMHLRSAQDQTVHMPALALDVSFAAGETIHTESSYKFTEHSLASLLETSGFQVHSSLRDEQNWFSVTIAAVKH